MIISKLLNFTKIINFYPSQKMQKTHLFDQVLKKSQQNSLINRFGFHYGTSQNEILIDFEKDYYEILGIEPNAQLLVIKQKFYQLAKQYHPDKEKGKQQEFKEINQAYNILSQTILRNQYDKYYNSNSDGNESNKRSSSMGKNLSYEAYSQISREQWARYRNGEMKTSTVDYSNFENGFDDQHSDTILRIKNIKQWQTAINTVTNHQVQQEQSRLQLLNRKIQQERQLYAQRKQQFQEQYAQELAAKIQKALGKKGRSIFQYFLKK